MIVSIVFRNNITILYLQMDDTEIKKIIKSGKKGMDIWQMKVTL